MKVDLAEEMENSQQIDLPLEKEKDIGLLKRKKKIYIPVSKSARKKAVTVIATDAIAASGVPGVFGFYFTGAQANHLVGTNFNLENINLAGVSLHSPISTQNESRQAQR